MVTKGPIILRQIKNYFSQEVPSAAMYACMYDIYSLVYTLCYIKCVALITTTYTFEAEAWNAQTDQAAMDLIITSAHLKKKTVFLSLQYLSTYHIFIHKH